MQNQYCMQGCLVTTNTHYSKSISRLFAGERFILSLVAVQCTPIFLSYFSLLLCHKMLSQITFTQIRDNYYYGYYGLFRVVVDKTDGYINASKLCIDGGKQFYHWKESKAAKELLNTLQRFTFNQAFDDESTQEPWSIAHYAPVSQITRLVQTFNASDEDRIISGPYVYPL